MFKIDNDIPAPTSGRTATPDSKTGVLRMLEVGQSVFFRDVRNMTGFIRNIQLDKDYEGRMFTTRTTEEDDPDWVATAEQPKAPKVRGVRVWRIEDAPKP